MQILQKFNPGILALPNSNQILYTIRPKWIHSADWKIEEILMSQQQSLIRSNYRKLMKVLLDYCRHPKAKPNAIIDLAKGYRNHSFIDMAPVRMFFLFELPYKFSIERSKELILAVLMRIAGPTQNTASMSSYESNIQCFDLIFMSIVTRYTDNDIMFRELFDQKVLTDFMETLFGTVKYLPAPGSLEVEREEIRVEEIKVSLESSPYYSSEQFFIEVAKVLNLVFRYFDLATILQATPHQDLQRIN